LNKKEEILAEHRNIVNLVKRLIFNSHCAHVEDKLTPANGQIIGYLYHNQNRDIFQKNIEEEFSIRRSTVSKTLRLMEEKDYIKRESVDGDARLRKISLTPKALRIADFIESDMQKLQDIAFNGISDSDLEVIFRVAVKVRENIENALGSH